MKSPIEQAIESLSRLKTNLEEINATNVTPSTIIDGCINLLQIHKEYEDIYYKGEMLKDRLEQLTDKSKVNV